MDTITATAKQETAVYSSYRRILKSLSAGGNRNSRAGERKQKARVITSERYKLPISTVKSIVRKFDEQLNIFHEPTANLIERRRLEGLYEAALEQALISNPDRNCSHCGGTPTDELTFADGKTGLRGPSKVRFDPRYYEVHSEPRFLDVCLRCWIIELDYSINDRYPAVWSSQTV